MSAARLAVLILGGMILCQNALGDTAGIPREEVRTHFKVLRRLNPKVGDLFRKLVAKYGDKSVYPAEEVQAIAAPKAKTEPRSTYEPKPNRQGTAVPPGAISAADAKIDLRAHAKRTGSKDDLVAALEEKYGAQPWYLAQEVRDVHDNAFAPEPIPLPPPRAPLKQGWEPIVGGLAHIKIRQSWADVTAGEDPSVGGNKSGRRPGGSILFLCS